MQLVGRGALSQRKQPARIAHEHRLIRRRGSPELVEHGLNLLEPLGRRAPIPEPHREQHEPPQQIQIEQRVRVRDPSVMTRPTRALPHQKRAAHHLRGIDEVVVVLRCLARLEAAGPVRLLQLRPEARLVGGNSGEREETILEVARQKGNVL